MPTTVLETMKSGGDGSGMSPRAEPDGTGNEGPAAGLGDRITVD